MKSSHKVLIGLLSVAIVVSLATTFFTSDSDISREVDTKLRFNILDYFGRLTAYGSSGFVNVTINNLTQINLTTTDCNFGTGYITVGQTNATLESNGTIYNWQGSGTSASIDVRNDGNWNVSLNVSSGKTLTNFYGTDCSVAGQGCAYNFWSANNESSNGGACTSGLVSNPGTAMNTSNKTVCSKLRYEDANDEVNVYCRLVIYQTVPTGAKTDTWTFWATNV